MSKSKHELDEDPLDPDQDIDSALTAFDHSKWKEKINKILIEEKEAPLYYDPYDRPLNRFR